MTVEVPLTRGQVALVDDDDLELVSQNRWHAIPGTRTWYAHRWLGRPDGGTIQSMHQLLTGWDRTDHVNGNGLDNRRANLRQATGRCARRCSCSRRAAGSCAVRVSGWRSAGIILRRSCPHG